MDNHLNKFIEWCQMYGYDTTTYKNKPTLIFNCRETDKVWKMWQSMLPFMSLHK